MSSGVYKLGRVAGARGQALGEAMRIGIVCHPSVGGSGLVASELALRLADASHEVHVISKRRPFRLAEDEDRLTVHPVDQTDYPLFEGDLYLYALAAKIAEVVVAHELDLVHVHYAIPHAAAAWIARDLSDRRFPIVTTLHGTDVTVVGQRPEIFPVNRLSIEQSDAVTTVSRFQQIHILKNFGARCPVQVIPNFIDPNQFSPARASREARARLAGDDEFLIMHTSNFRPLKNIGGVIESFRIAAERVRARLVLVGDGPEIDPVRARCQEHGLSDRVTFLGEVQTTADLIANADCVLQPSYTESFSMVALEAMAAAVPVVASNRGGIPEVVAHGVTGFVEDPDDHEALAGKLVELGRDRDLGRRMGANGRRRAIGSFHWSDRVTDYELCYRACLARPAAARQVI